MKIVPFGKQKGQEDEFFVYADLLEDTGISTDKDSAFDLPAGSQSPGKTKIDEVQSAIENVVGEPSLDNLMIILAAIGMSKIGMNLSEDGSSLSVSGIISFTAPEEKISKKE